MIVVIQCSGSKQPDAGHLRTPEGTPVMFVARPEVAPARAGLLYARPDDVAGGGKTWRDVLLEYNSHPQDNPCRLLPAFRLYEERAYAGLVEAFGPDHVYILSAGWGLIAASFLTPDYDITFSQSAEPFQRRRKRDRYRDFRMPSARGDEPIVFLGGKDYVPPFCALTSEARGRRTVFFNSTNPPDAPGCALERYETRTRTNWHYECAEAVIRGA
ncbi:MAG: hypothetical protein AB7O37_18155 [Vicinamibacteria bacterium]